MELVLISAFVSNKRMRVFDFDSPWTGLTEAGFSSHQIRKDGKINLWRNRREPLHVQHLAFNRGFDQKIEA